MKKSKIVIDLKGIGKKYNLGFFTKKFPFFSKKSGKSDVKWALKNINLKVKAGQKIGITGPNGSGKTTLLKIMSGITSPTEGSITYNGKIAAILDLEHGFNPDLTGIENIYLNAISLGMLKSEVDERIDEIIDFADIGDYINYPFYTYSQGMKFRLACSVSLVYEADLLIIDEVLISGDFDFQKKVLDVLVKMQTDTKMATIICSHNPQTLWAFADEYYLMQDGILKKINKRKITKMSLDVHEQFHHAFRTKDIFKKNV